MPHLMRGLTLLLLFALLTEAQATRAQAGRSEITGIVHDQSGALIPQGRIRVTEVSTEQIFTAIVGDAGTFTLTNLKPGPYTIAVEVPGFKTYVRSGVQLATGERVRLDITLEPGQLSESVTISEDASPLRTESGSLGQVVNNRKIVDLPLNGRNFLSLVSLSAGVAQPPPTTAGPSFPRINGGRPRTNEYLFDGISVLQPEPGQIAFFPVIESVQEFKVEVNSPPAEFGRFNGGVVNLTMKSGTNNLHGTVFEFVRNEALNARNLFAAATAANPKKPVFRRNQFGFVLGGPIIKDNTFFFGDYQGTRQLIARVRISTVPTLAQRQGNFANSLGAPLFFQSNGSIGTNVTANPVNVTDTNGNTIQARAGQIFRPSNHRAYAGNIIPTNTFDPAAALLLQRYPPPTSSGAANNFTLIGNEPNDQDQFDFRLDHRFSSHDANFNAFAGYGTQRPNRVSDPNLPASERTTAGFFNTSAFIAAPQFTPVNSSRNPVRGPAYRNADLVLIKRIFFGETTNVELRAEAFNVTNTPPLAAPNTVVGAPGFGSITAAGDPRVFQLGAKFSF